MFKDIRYYDYYFRALGSQSLSIQSFQYYVYVRNYHKLNDLKHQFIIIIAHDFVGQEFRQGSIGNAPHCSPMAGSPLGNRLLKTGGAPFSLQPLRGWFGLPHISAASKF